MLIPAISATTGQNNSTYFFEVLDSRMCDSSQRHTPGEAFQPLFIDFYITNIPNIKKFRPGKAIFWPIVRKAYLLQCTMEALGL